MKFDIKTNIEDLEDDFKEANSIDEIKNTDDLLQLYHFSTLDDFEKIRRRFYTCFNHFWVKFHYEDHDYDLIDETDFVLEYVSIWILSVEKKRPINQLLVFDVKTLSLGWEKLGDVCLQKNLKDVAIECRLFSSLMKCLIPEYEKTLTAIKKAKEKYFDESTNTWHLERRKRNEIRL